MRSSQLTCPYCGSLLNFNQAVAAGTPLPCLICNQTFLAPVALTGAATPVLPTPVPTPRLETPAAPRAIAAVPPAVKPASQAPHAGPQLGRPVLPRSTTAKAQPIRSEEDVGPSAIGRLLGGAALASVVLLLLGTLGFFFWKNVLSVPRDDRPGVPVVIAKGPTEAVVPAEPKIEPARPAAAKKADDDPDEPDEPAPVVAKPKPLITQVVKKETPVEVASTTPAVKVRTSPVASNAAGVDQAGVEGAIARGLRFLKSRHQEHTHLFNNPNSYHSAGIGSLVGLTLLECNAPANDPYVRDAAKHVRAVAPSLNQVYDVALSILFLDRLGEPADVPLIQGLALRLLGSQQEAGGWGYLCSPLSGPDMKRLYHFLQERQPLRKASPKAVRQTAPKGSAPGRNPNDAFGQLVDLMPAPKENKGPDGAKKPVKSVKFQPVSPRQYPLNREAYPLLYGMDNSNTQFALLALWAARRHDIPVDSSMLLAQQHFLRTRHPDGGWGYAGNSNKPTPSMTCVGLLGLAMGHGVSPESRQNGNASLQDPVITEGLRTLGGSIGIPQQEPPARAELPSLYFLWSVERVAMLYELNTIGGKDWYGWGAQMLLASQDGDGHWSGAAYTGATPDFDTCFALLFLRRSNLVQDLTENLRLFMAIRDPEAK